MKILLVQPPRLFWPYVNAGDNFMAPQNLCALAAVLAVNRLQVKIVDCLPLQLGWRSLAALLAKEKPDVIAAGENHAVFAHEVTRLAQVAKEVCPRAKVVVGGSHFSFLWSEYLAKTPQIDYIIQGEGEETLLELAAALANKNADLSAICGLAWRQDGRPRLNEPRTLIPDLDVLPLPAYHLIPMHLYGSSRYLFGASGSTIHHSRGCRGGCDFCAFWINMATRRIENQEEILIPCWRTKSPERTFAEVELLYKKYHKKFLVWVDDTWNTDQQWSDRFCDLLLNSKMKLGWAAFLRADLLIKDEDAGILEKMVQSGLVHASIGAERPQNEELKRLGKAFYQNDVVCRAADILKNNYPKVFRQFTFITGLPEDNAASMRDLVSYARRLHADYPGFHPLTPVPGTPLYKKLKDDALLEIKDFKSYDWMTPVMATKHLSREEVEAQNIDLSRQYVSAPWLLNGLTRGRYRRRMFIWWLIVTARLMFHSLFRFRNPFGLEFFGNMVKPRWYEN